MALEENIHDWTTNQKFLKGIATAIEQTPFHGAYLAEGQHEYLFSDVLGMNEQSLKNRPLKDLLTSWFAYIDSALREVHHETYETLADSDQINEFYGSYKFHEPRQAIVWAMCLATLYALTSPRDKAKLQYYVGPIS